MGKLIGGLVNFFRKKGGHQTQLGSLPFTF